MHPVLQNARKVQKLEEKHGHIISKYLQTQLIIRKQFSRSSGKSTDKNLTDGPMKDLDVNTAIWGIFLNAALRAAVHLGQDYEANLRYVKNHLCNSARQLFSETGKLISGQTENTGINTIDFKDLTCMSTSLLNSRAYQYSNAKAYVFSDSVLCLGKMGDDPIATWKSNI